MLSTKQPALSYALKAVALLHRKDQKLLAEPRALSIQQYYLMASACVRLEAKSLETGSKTSLLAASLLLVYFNMWRNDLRSCLLQLTQAAQIVENINDSIVERNFLQLMLKRGWNTLPQTAIQRMLNYGVDKKRTLIDHDSLTEVEGKIKETITSPRRSHKSISAGKRANHDLDLHIIEHMIGVLPNYDGICDGSLDRPCHILGHEGHSDHENFSDLVWALCKVDVLQSIVTGNALM